MAARESMEVFIEPVVRFRRRWDKLVADSARVEHLDHVGELLVDRVQVLLDLLEPLLQPVPVASVLVEDGSDRCRGNEEVLADGTGCFLAGRGRFEILQALDGVVEAVAAWRGGGHAGEYDSGDTP